MVNSICGNEGPNIALIEAILVRPFIITKDSLKFFFNKVIDNVQSVYATPDLKNKFITWLVEREGVDGLVDSEQIHLINCLFFQNPDPAFFLPLFKSKTVASNIFSFMYFTGALSSAAAEDLPTDSLRVCQAITKNDCDYLRDNVDKVVDFHFDFLPFKQSCKESLLHFAASCVSPKAMDFLLSLGKFDIKILDQKDCSLWMTMIACRNVLVFECLVKKYGCIDYGTYEGYTILQQAIGQGVEKFVDILMAEGFHLKQSKEESFTSLLVCCQTKNLNLLKKLAEAGANLTALGPKGETLLHAAAASGSLEIVEYLIPLYPSVDAGNYEGGYPLEVAYYHEFSGIVKRLIRAGAKAEISPHLPPILHKACLENDLEMVEVLIEKKANLEVLFEGRFFPLTNAVVHNRYEIVNALLEAGVSVNVELIDPVSHKKIYPLPLAWNNGHFSICRSLVERGADFRSDCMGPENKGEKNQKIILCHTLGLWDRLLLELNDCRPDSLSMEALNIYLESAYTLQGAALRSALLSEDIKPSFKKKIEKNKHYLQIVELEKQRQQDRKNKQINKQKRVQDHSLPPPLPAELPKRESSRVVAPSSPDTSEDLTAKELKLKQELTRRAKNGAGKKGVGTVQTPTPLRSYEWIAELKKQEEKLWGIPQAAPVKASLTSYVTKTSPESLLSASAKSRSVSAIVHNPALIENPDLIRYNPNAASCIPTFSARPLPIQLTDEQKEAHLKSAYSCFSICKEAVKLKVPDETKIKVIFYRLLLTVEMLRWIPEFSLLNDLRQDLRHFHEKYTLADLVAIVRFLDENGLENAIDILKKGGHLTDLFSSPAISRKPDASTPEDLLQLIRTELEVFRKWKDKIEGDAKALLQDDIVTAGLHGACLRIGSALTRLKNNHRYKFKSSDVHKIIRYAADIAHEKPDAQLVDLAITDRLTSVEAYDFLQKAPQYLSLYLNKGSSHK